MAAGNIVDVHEVEPGVDVRGHPARGGVEDHAAGRRRLDVAGADRRRRIHDHDRVVELVGAAAHRLLGEELRALVGADHVVERHGRRLVGRRAVAIDPEHRDARRIDEPLDACRRGGLEHVHGPFDVRAVHRQRIRDPEPIVGRDVEHRVAAARRGAQRLAVGQVALGELDVETLEVAPIAAAAHERAHGAAVREQRAHDGRAQEAVRAGDEAQHRTHRSARSCGRPRAGADA